MTADKMQTIMMPDPKDVKMAQLEARIAELEGKGK